MTEDEKKIIKKLLEIDASNANALYSQARFFRQAIALRAGNRNEALPIVYLAEEWEKAVHQSFALNHATVAAVLRDLLDPYDVKPQQKGDPEK